MQPMPVASQDECRAEENQKKGGEWMNYTLLKSIMVLNHDTNRTLAEFLGITLQTMGSKMNGGSEFKQGEISKIKHRYSLDADLIDSIFFADTVSNLDTERTAS